MNINVPDGDLSPEQAAALLDEVMHGDDADVDLDDDATESAEDDAVADDVVEDAAQKETPETEAETEAEVADTPNLAEKLAALEAELAALKAEKQPQAETPKTVADLPESVQELAEKSGVSDEQLAEMFGDFSEKDIVKGVQQLVQMQVADEVDKRVQAALQPLQAREQQAQLQAHYQAILSAHPDAGELADSPELKAWVEKLPKYAQNGVREILDKGSAADIIDVLNDFKAATGRVQAKQPEPQPETKKAKVPDTLGQIPAGRAAVSQQEVLGNLPPEKLVERLSELSPEQIEKFLNGI
ncbi:hypothetical protein [Wielerella bovis]|uniref:hypothetical protein n=1 Tax=Wielerella bovis TaxID=2917790 RepID=UPI0020186693|nr:hypothetical protein [Wielerella bovis]ULJ66651.1 hypothetical protein MIS31_10440 [Wielerella bovis]